MAHFSHPDDWTIFHIAERGTSTSSYSLKSGLDDAMSSHHPASHSPFKPKVLPRDANSEDAKLLDSLAFSSSKSKHSRSPKSHSHAAPPKSSKSSSSSSSSKSASSRSSRPRKTA
ncbi:unnamed protein product [Agarophyton chilense]